MEDITLYTTHCPKCCILEEKMKDKHIEYNEVNDVQEMLKLGMKSTPVLKVGDKVMTYLDAVHWVNGQER